MEFEARTRMEKQLAFNADRLRRLREGAGMDQAELGARLLLIGASKQSVSRQRVSLWETGVCDPQGRMLVGLARIFGTTVESFFDGTD